MDCPTVPLGKASLSRATPQRAADPGESGQVLASSKGTDMGFLGGGQTVQRHQAVLQSAGAKERGCAWGWQPVLARPSGQGLEGFERPVHLKALVGSTRV